MSDIVLGSGYKVVNKSSGSYILVEEQAICKQQIHIIIDPKVTCRKLTEEYYRK